MSHSEEAGGVSAETGDIPSLSDLGVEVRVLIDSIRDYAIFMLSTEGRILTWNSGARAIKGYLASEIIGQSIECLYTPEDRASRKPERLLKTALEVGRVEDEGWRLRKDGSRFWADVIITPVRDEEDGRLRGFVKVTRDLTERRRIEQEVQEERNRAAAAQCALQERDEFLSVAAHELRTPLTALQLKLQSLARMLGKPGSEPHDLGKIATRVDGTVKQTERLAQLVERLLDVSSIVVGKLEMSFEELDLCELVQRAVEPFQEPARQVGSELRVQLRGPVVGAWDRIRLGQMVSDLLSNAVKYGEGNPIDVLVEEVGEAAQLVITDRGLGISPDDVERVFGRFERASSIRHYGGLGLGLYMARYIVEAHGGSIELDSRPGAGSTFLIKLPRQRP